MANYVTVTSDKSKTVAFLLCLFFGYLGIHYFYVGRIGRGVVALFTLNFILIGWVVDLFSILLGSFKDNTGTALRK